MASATWASNPWLWVVSFKRLDVQNAPPMEDLGAKERPILFRGSMVRAILEGRKTQTRRVMSPQPGPFLGVGLYYHAKDYAFPIDDRPSSRRELLEVCSYGKPGDRLWVRETWGRPPTDFRWDASKSTDANLEWPVLYRADGDRAETELFRGRWRPSNHMPRWACRLVLEVTDVRVERLQDISEEDAKAEGVALNPVQPGTWINYPERSSAAGWCYARESFRSLWESIHG